MSLKRNQWRRVVGSFHQKSMLSFRFRSEKAFRTANRSGKNLDVYKPGNLIISIHRLQKTRSRLKDARIRRSNGLVLFVSKSSFNFNLNQIPNQFPISQQFLSIVYQVQFSIQKSPKRLSQTTLTVQLRLQSLRSKLQFTSRSQFTFQCETSTIHCRMGTRLPASPVRTGSFSLFTTVYDTKYLLQLGLMSSLNTLFSLCSRLFTLFLSLDTQKKLTDTLGRVLRTFQVPAERS